MSKYGNRKIRVDGMLFDSQKEARRWVELTVLQKLGKISNLERQKEFVLIGTQRIAGKVVERPVKYKADFVYLEDGELVVEDVKGMPRNTPEFVIKRKLMLFVHGIKVREVR